MTATPQNKSAKDSSSNSTNTSPTQSPPDNVLIWAGTKNDHAIHHTLNGLGLAEAFKSLGSGNVTLCSNPLLNIAEDCQSKSINWKNLNENDFLQTVQSINPEVIFYTVAPGHELADTVIDQLPMIFYIAPHFEPQWMNTDGLIIPSIVSEPDFMTLPFLPTRLTECLHGPDYICLPASYKRMAHDVGSGVLISIHKQIGFEEESPWLAAIREVYQENFRFLMDGPEEQARHFSQGYGEGRVRRVRDSLKKRIQTIDSAEVIISLASPSVYEFLGRGKVCVILARNEEELHWAALIEEQGAALVLSTSSETFQSDLEQSLKILSTQQNKRSSLENNAGKLVTANGSTRLINELLSRYA